MNTCDRNILVLDEVRECLKLAISSKKLVCIGVDGPTASGKTIFAQLLKNEISQTSIKDVQIIPLDSLLIEREFRQKSLQNILKVGIPFEHEAEVHMRFSKFEALINMVKLKKRNLFEERKIILEDLYSRDDDGRCSGKLEININNNSILIFEGHYTTRPEFQDVLDKNFILLANRKNLINRKIERVADYRNKKEVEDYFELIDEPSYLSNYYRFASRNCSIIDNSVFSRPFIVNYSHIDKLLDTDKFLHNKKNSSKKIKEFMFGLHGLSNYNFFDENNIENLITDLNCENALMSRKSINKIFFKNNILNNISYYDYKTSNEVEIGLIAKLFGKNVIWVISKKFKEIRHLIFWEGGVFKIESEIIERLLFQTKKNYFLKKRNTNFWDNLQDNKSFISTSLLREFTDPEINNYTFLDNAKRVSFLATALLYTQFECRSLGDFVVVAHRDFLDGKYKEITSNSNSFRIDQLSFVPNENDNFQKNSKDYFLTKDFLLIKSNLNKKVLKELEDIFFKSEDINLRTTIFEGLLHEENSCFLSDDFRNFLKYAVCFFPVSMSRLYLLKRMGLEETNVLAANIYDITENPIDSSAYLSASFENSLPTILQVSLNACGQSEFNNDGLESIGYLKPKQGIRDFTNSLINVFFEFLKNSKTSEFKRPLIGVGLDHVDVKGDNPPGRSSRFVKEALKTEFVTHLTLDGSAFFKPIDKSSSELFKAYVEVFRNSLKFIDKVNLDRIDMEFCTGELNYIGEETKPHYPDGKEISSLPIFFSYSLEHEHKFEDKAVLLNMMKLYVANLGTTHHGNDKESSLKIGLSEEWQNALKGSNFVSPVLHGTTGSSDETFFFASKFCYKINIAGSFLKILLENLNQSEKEIIGFDTFNEKSKYLCSKFDLIKKDLKTTVTKQLKSEFSRYCKLNGVKPILEKNEKIIRKPIYGRNKISRYIFSKLEEKLIL
tara:strand:+ start:175 stop:3027 length:2853 start_codon:yes stop_codon:yes gene_type:complete